MVGNLQGRTEKWKMKYLLKERAREQFINGYVDPKNDEMKYHSTQTAIIALLGIELDIEE